MKTIKQALIDEVAYPLGEGAIENKLIARGIDSEETFSTEVANSREYRGALADCLYSLIDAPNFSEAGYSISLSDKDAILKKANSLYSSIGEETKGYTPKVQRISWQSLRSGKIGSK